MSREQDSKEGQNQHGQNRHGQNQQGQYNEEILASMQRIFGKGFLSPGGEAEVRRVMAGLDLTDKQVLDLGCGLGGCTVVLGGALGAGSVLGIDIDDGNLAHARAAVAEAGLTETVGLQLVEPGPLPFPDDRFDVVFSKAVICHIEHKSALFAEVCRVLRPDGCFVGADWMTGAEDNLSQAYHDWDQGLRDAGLEFHFESGAVHRRAFDQAGFARSELSDDSEWACDGAVRAQAVIDGEGRRDLEAALGPAGYAAFARRCEARIEALSSGDLRYQHFRAFKED